MNPSNAAPVRGIVFHCPIILLICFHFTNGTYAQSFPTGFTRVQVASGINNPTAIAFAPDGRIFVTQQNGALKIIKNGSLLPTSFLQLNVNSSGERGLLGIALDPNFSTNQFVYLYYTLPNGSNNRISRFKGNGDVVLAGSEVILLDLDPLSSATNHNGGAMHFGLDGKLYVAIGENANTSNSQNLETYHGKVLRINSDGSVPTGNPFTGSDKKRRIWAYGLRNPFTFAIQRSTGKLFINDVGKDTWEEINNGTTGGKNFGWPTAEGASSNTSFTNPVYAYAHGTGDGKGCAITGGVFFNPSTTNYPPQYIGKYFFQDLCNGWINTLDITTTPATRSPFATSIGSNALGLDVGTDGNIYFLARDAGALYKIIYTTNTAPTIVTHPSSVSVAEGQPATFSVTATGSAPLNYQWQKNSVNITGANASSYNIAATTPGNAGSYSVIVSNSLGSVTSNPATLTVTAFNSDPVAQIITPTEGGLYEGGMVINFSGHGTDDEDGALPASAFTWTVNFHHDTHIHDGPPVASGVKSGSFTAPTSGEVSSNVWYRLILKVTDSKGLQTTVFRDILPSKSTIGLATQPTGLQVTLDGQAVTTPFSIIGVVGIQRTIGVVSPQTSGEQTYEFARWSHGGTATQSISTPTNDITYTAVFHETTSSSITPGIYNLIAVHSDKYLDVTGGSLANNAQVIQWKNTAGNNQKFKIESAGSGYYRITSMHSNKAIEVKGSSVDSGAAIVQNVFTESDNQLWSFFRVGTDAYLIKNKFSEKFVDVSGRSTQDGAKVIQWTSTGRDNQNWRLIFLSSLPVFSNTSEENENFSTAIFPNPSQGEFSINLLGFQTPVNIDVINIRGKTIQSYRNFSKENISLDIQEKGLYTVRFTSGKFTQVKRIFIE